MAHLILIEGVTAKLYANPKAILSVFYPGAKTISVTVLGNALGNTHYIDLETKEEAEAAFRFVQKAMLEAEP